MQQILLIVLLGLGSGALIAALALGVVVTYRGSGIINLAVGGVAMLAGYAFWSLNTGALGVALPTVPALVISVVFILAVGAVIELVAFRPLRTAAPLAKLVASLGVLLVAQAAMLLAFGTSQQPAPQILPQAPVPLLGAVVPVDRFILAGLVIMLAAVLAALYRWTRFGVATRAASENEVAAILSGLSPNVISLVNTEITALIAGGVGILAASVTQLDSSTLPLQIVPALAAALLAGFTSFGVACGAGLGIGVVYSLITYASAQAWFPTSDGTAIPGVQELAAFVIIIVAMFVRGARLPARGELVEQRLPGAPRPRRLIAWAVPVTVVGAVALVVLPYDFRQALVVSLIGMLMALSLVVITGFVGQISVVQLALAGVSGFTISHLASDAGIGFPLSALAGIAVAVVLGLVTAVSALRVRGVSLAVVTLAAAVAIANFGFLNTTWGGGSTGSPVPEPGIAGLDLGPKAAYRGFDGDLPSPVFGWVALVATVLLCLLVGYLRRGTLGRRMLAVRSNERAAAAAAVNPRTVKLAAFGIAAFIAGVAGTLYAYNFGSVSADRFSAVTALSLIAFAYAGGITQISGAVFAGLISAQALVPYALDRWFGLNGNWFLLFGGAILIFTLIQNPGGVAGDIHRRTHKRKAPVAPEPAPASPAPPGTEAAVTPDAAAPPSVAPGPAGPSGPGPVSEAAVASPGPVPAVRADPARVPDAGSDDAPGSDPTGGIAAASTPGTGVAAASAPGDGVAAAAGPRARPDGLGGSPVLRVEDLSVRFGGVQALREVSLEVRDGELVGLIGPNGAGKSTLVDAISGFVRGGGRVELDGKDIGRLPAYERARRGLARTWQSTDLFHDLDVRENLQVAAGSGGDAGRCLDIVGMGWAADAMPDELSEAGRKLVGVARALSGDHRLVCLDEPAAGLDRRESAQLGHRLRTLADDGQSILLIDHDMGLVLTICDRVVVLEFGQVIADGPPEAVRRNPRVIAAYLGGGDPSQAAAQEG